MRHPDIVLKDDELALLSRINFNWGNLGGIRASLEPMYELTIRLLKRKAVPEARIAYFTNPDFNPGGRGKSREDIFRKNGTSGDEILRHPNFLRYLEYFIFGPKLPPAVIDKFRSESSFSGYLTGGDINDLTPYARSCVRLYGLDPQDAAEEFYKLATEHGAMPSFAETMRRSVRAVKIG
ncbi:hypothetical protein [Dyella subtropica]|uniref:hypothetical protein n=1 Tax=Dyella subtropica TaxID=2992127 RepID=UPI0022506FCA|nr:hypothetical protein [Dyella subtropica]